MKKQETAALSKIMQALCKVPNYPHGDFSLGWVSCLEEMQRQFGQAFTGLKCDLKQFLKEPERKPSASKQPAGLFTPKEMIEWIDVNDRVPDVDNMVLIFTTDSDDEPVWYGYMDQVKDAKPFWIYAEGTVPKSPVTYWAVIPTGPRGAA